MTWRLPPETLTKLDELIAAWRFRTGQNLSRAKMIALMVRRTNSTLLGNWVSIEAPPV